MTDSTAAPPDLETFLLEPANRQAAAAARAIADGTAVPEGPLVVLGQPGTGKTGLLEAIAGRLLSRHPRARVELLSPDLLAERYRGALVLGRGDGFRAELVGADLLLLDDLERLARHRDCQGLVAELLDARRTAGRPTVVTAARAAEEQDGLDARLVRRLAEGVTVLLSIPGPAVRTAILLHRLGGNPGALPEDVVRALAAIEFPSMRDYTGALARLVAFQEASAVPLSPDDAVLLIGAPPPGETPAPAGLELVAPPAAPEPEPPSETEPPAVAERPSVTEPPLAAAPGEADEFGEFLSEVTASLSEQVDHWRRQLGDAIWRWQREGLRTRRLHLLLDDETPVNPGSAIEAFERDAREILALAREAAALAPDLAGAELFRDPDQVAEARALCEQARARSAPITAPLTHFRLEEFAQGPSNHSALEAVRELLAEPGLRRSPLVVLGGAGVGKSHLLHAIGNSLAARGVGPVACLGGQGFVAEVKGQAGADPLAGWRLRYRWVGALILDDLHLLAGEDRVQVELASLVAELLEGRRQMVFASARPLGELSGLDPRLRGLLERGDLVQLGPPDREIRLGVVKRLLAGTKAAEDAALADYLAGRGADSVRAVHRLVQRVLDAAAQQRAAPSPALARQVLEAQEESARFASVSAPIRASGILAPGMGLLRSREKMIEEWPALGDRLMAELR
jgi:chromosomal replication initiation ATPase DnaA